MSEQKTVFRGLLQVSLSLVCPACLRGRLFRSGYELNERCAACGQNLVGTDGAQYGGPMVLGYAIGGTAGLLVAVLLFLLPGTAAFALPAGLFVTVVTVILTFRNCKAAWTWLLFRTDQLPGADGPLDF
ncbi:MAG: DUF983 domain-containing protein [Gemmatimonadota bacterium]